MNKIIKIPKSSPIKFYSRLARRGIDLSGVKWELLNDQEISVEYNGDIKYKNDKIKNRKRIFSVSEDFSLKIENQICFILVDDKSIRKPMQGTYTSLFRNMIEGVSKLHTGSVEVVGSGYSVELTRDNKLDMGLGYNSHIFLDIPEQMSVQIKKVGTGGKASRIRVDVTGVDKQNIMDFIAKMEKLRVPDNYKVHGVLKVGKYYHKKQKKGDSK